MSRKLSKNKIFYETQRPMKKRIQLNVTLVWGSQGRVVEHIELDRISVNLELFISLINTFASLQF